MANPIVTFEMENGDIMKAELYPEIAPNTVTVLLRRCIMNKQKTVDSKVLEILRECPETRYDDMQLILCYYNRYSYMRVGDLPLEDIVNNYKGYGLPCFETIRRARQRVQSLFPELSRQCSGCDCGNIRIVIEVS